MTDTYAKLASACPVEDEPLLREICYENLKFLGFPDYRVGDDGSIWSRLKRVPRRGGPEGFGTKTIRTKKWQKLRLKLCRGAKQVLVTLCHKGTRKAFTVHRLVLLAFVGPCPKGMQGCHFPDRNPGNNQLSNLRWDTGKANQADRIIHGTDCRGDKHPMAVLNEDTVKLMRGVWENERPRPSKIEIARRFGYDRSTVSLALRGVTWKHI